MSELQKINDSQQSNQSSSSKTTKTSTKTVKSSRTVTTSTVSKSSTSSSSTSSTSKAEEIKESSTKSLTGSETSGIRDCSNASDQIVSTNQPQTQTAAQKKAVQTVVEEKVEVQKSELVTTSQIVVGADGVELKTEEVKEDQKVETAAHRDEKKQEIIEKMMTNEAGDGVCLAQMIKEEASQASQKSAAEASAFTRTGPQGTESGHHEDAKEESTFRREIRVQANAAAYVEKFQNPGEYLKLMPSKNENNEVGSIVGGVNSDQTTLNFDLSEFETESISIIIENNKMTVHAVKKRKAGDEDSKEEFSRVYDLPEDQIDQDQVTSSMFQDGVLSIELPYKSAILGH